MINKKKYNNKGHRDQESGVKKKIYGNRIPYNAVILIMFSIKDELTCESCKA